MQRLTAALEQALVGRVLNQRVLEAVGRLRSSALDEQEVGLRKPVQSRLQRALVEAGHGAQQRVREISAQHRADLRGLARFAEPVEPRGERLLQGRRDRLRAALFAALQQEARHLLDEQRHAAGALAHPFDHVPRQRMAGRESRDHLRDLRAIERRQRDDAVVRAHAPRRAELRPRGRDDQQRRLRAALGERAHEIERSRVGPVQVLEGEHDGCDRAPARTHAVIAASCRRRNSSGANFAARSCGRENIDQRRERAHIRLGQVRSDPKWSRGRRALFGRSVRAEALAAPFGDRMQRRVLQQLRGRPFDPGVRRLAEPALELLDEARLADAGLADNQRELAFAFRARSQRRVRRSSSSSRPTSGVRRAPRRAGRRRSPARCDKA